MTPFYADDHMTLYGGDCREVLRELPAESVHCVVTSPPYWGLRDYGTATWEGGDPACDHLNGPLASAKSGLQGGKVKDTDKIRTNGMPFRASCGKCGAIRQDSQLGLEPTPEAYVANMVAVFREVRRVLRADGTLWLNLGDSYATGAGKASSPGGGPQGERFMESGPSGYRGAHDLSPKHTRPQTPDGKNPGAMIPTFQPNRMPIAGLKPKDLVGIPWRVAFALQADGWYLRSDIIWAKPNPMPESVTDRPTKAHEYLFLLSKSARYYYDADAVREANSNPDLTEMRVDWRERPNNGEWPSGTGGRMGSVTSGRNLRSVWTIATEPYPGAHFATFPRRLVEPCVKAGCPTDGVVLDPFAGSGTTLLVAQALGRKAIGIDLNPDYLRQALARNAQAPLGLEVSA